jgi:hypothetical protein
MRSRLKLLLLPALLGTASAALAQSMNAEAFYQRATALQRKGPFALFSNDASVLMAEGKAAGQKSREQRQASIAAGQKPRFCPPPGKVNIGSSEFVKRLGAIPATQRRTIDMTEATTRILAAKFPC